MSKNLLMVLRPHIGLTFEDACKAAFAAKTLGMNRLDVISDRPLSDESLSHANKAAIPDFMRANQTLAASVLTPVVGASDVYGLRIPALPAMPDPAHLSNFGRTLLQRAHADPDKNYSSSNRDIGLVLYLTFTGKARDQSPYDALIFPGMTDKSYESLEDAFPRSVTAKDGNRIIQLSHLRHFYQQGLTLRKFQTIGLSRN